MGTHSRSSGVSHPAQAVWRQPSLAGPWETLRASVTPTLMLLALLAFGATGCTRPVARGIQVIPTSNRHVLALNADDVVQIMRRAGFTDRQILEYGTDLRDGLAKSGAVQIKIGRTVEAIFAINLDGGKCVYISTRLRGNFIYNVETGWVGGAR